MKVLLIFPPQWVPCQPYLSLPSLTAYLKSKGIKAIQKDFNVEAYDILLSKRYLNKMHERLSQRFGMKESKERLSSTEQKHYHALFITKALAPEVAERIDEAKRIFRSKRDFYNLTKLYESRETIRTAFAIIAIAHYPTRLDLSWFEMRKFHESLGGIKKATQNREENPFIELYESNLLPYINQQDPDIVGISIAGSTQIIPGLTLSRLLKSSACKAHVVVGGSIFTQLADVLPKTEELFQRFFDSVILYEGERPLLELVERLATGKSMRDVPNLIYHDGLTVHANEIHPPEEIDSLPTPCFDGLPLQSYFTPEPVLPVLSSRGCYWGRCAFCFHGLVYGGHYRCRSSKKVVDEIQELSKKHKTTHFAFSDECISPNAINALSEEILKRRLKISCLASVRFEPQFTEKLCDRIAKAGFKILYFGLESGCDRVLSHMRKGTDKQTIINVCRNVFHAGIYNHLFAFFGFPTETRGEAQETIDFLLSNSHIIRSFSIGAFILGKGSAVANNPETYGISRIHVGGNKELQFTYNYTVPSGLTQKEAKKMSDVFMDKIANEYENGEILKNLSYDNLLLYLSHYEKSDPLLKSMSISRERTNGKPPVQTRECNNWHVVPRLKDGVLCCTLRFNILEIQENIKRKTNTSAYPHETSIVYDPHTGNIVSITLSARKILDLWDGESGMVRIAHKLAKNYSVPLKSIKADCMIFLRDLAAQGFVEFMPRIEKQHLHQNH